MKTKLLLASVLGSLLVGGYPVIEPIQAQPITQAEPSSWQSFSDQDGGFTVLMPGTPTAKKQTQDSPIGTIDFYSFTTALEDKKVTYLVSYNDFPEAVLSLPPDILLDGLRSGLIADRTVRLVEEKTISLGEYPGKEFQLEIPGKVAIRHRAYLVKQRLYQVITETPLDQENELSDDIDKFMESFQLLG
ncbi:MAG TPA: hypothetical protein V6C95_22505 [Coleofasciculaceae cyanobacterium]